MGDALDLAGASLYAAAAKVTAVTSTGRGRLDEYPQRQLPRFEDIQRSSHAPTDAP